MAKLAMLQELWLKLVAELKEKATAGGDRDCDKKMLDVLMHIEEIPAVIRTTVLSNYQN